VPPLALVGNLSRDVVDGGPPRVGRAPYYAARAWRVLGTRGTIFTRSGPEDRRAYVRHVTALGLPVVSLEGTATTSFSFHYEGDTRIMTVVQPGDVWTPADAEVVPPGGWIHVAPLLRSDFPAETLGALARGRHLSLDGQGLVRASEPGPLRLDADFDPAMLEHVQILKLAEEEAEGVGAGHVRRTRLARVLQGPLGRGRSVAGRGRPDGLRRRLLCCLPRRQVSGHGSGGGGAAGDRRRRSAADRTADMTAAVRTASGTYVVDLEAEEVIGAGDDFEPPSVRVELPRVVAAAATGATVVAVVDRRPPLAISNDAGRTWREAGGGLPAGFAVAIDEDNPDVMLFAGRNRLYLSENGGIFWRALVPELPEIEAVAFL